MTRISSPLILNRVVLYLCGVLLIGLSVQHQEVGLWLEMGTVITLLVETVRYMYTS